MLNLNSTSTRSFDPARPVLSRLFGEMSEDFYTEISQMLTWVHFQSNDCIFSEGETGDSMFIVVHGRLRAIIEKEGKQTIIAEIGSGECVGEMSLLTGNPRNASIYAIRDCNLIRMSKGAFEKITLLRPQIGLNLSRLIIKRFTEKKSPRPIKSITNVALIPLHQTIDILEIKSSLEAALKKRKKIFVLSEEIVAKSLGEKIAQTAGDDNLKNSKLTRWFNELEEKNDFVFYLPDGKPSEWTKRCLRQADEIILIADSTQPSDLTNLEKELFYSEKDNFSTAKQTLVMLHPANLDMPAGTQNWLKNRKQINFHTHLRRNDLRGYERLGRYLSDESIGLVLAGGGIKGMAHVGVVKAMEELNIPIDFVGGTSMGAVVGGGIACGWEYERLLPIAHKLASEKPTTDYNLLPFISFLKGNQIENLLYETFGDLDMEDCFRSFYTVSANLSTSQQMVHRNDRIFDTIRASFSLPGVLPPKISPEGLLVDGGIVNNFPVDIMVGMGVKTIIGVDFGAPAEKLPDFDSYPTGLQILGNKIRGSKKYKGMPTLMNTIVKSTLLNSNYKTKEAVAMTDIFINPDTRNVGLLDWGATDIAIEAGYVAALEVFGKEWKG